MTVADLIAELQKMPKHAPVLVQTLLEFYIDDGSELPPNIAMSVPDRTESVEVSDVSWQGNHVEIA